MTNTEVRLTSLAHGGGCGCKLAPAVLRELLAGNAAAAFPQLLVGTETSDDAAVWQVDDETCIIATTDFFMPVVDNPHDFGRIAATNAISDVYAMGGKPIMALAILGMPLGKIAPDTVRDILGGGRSVCQQAGIPVAGGHSIDAPEPIYGLAVVGTAHPSHIRKNSSARPGDILILTKPIGVGVYSAALKKDVLAPEGYADMLASTTQLNSIGQILGKEKAVSAMTDVTGFGVLGHALEMATGSGCTIVLEAASMPFLPLAEELAAAGHVTGASHRNWASYGEKIDFARPLEDWQRHLLTDPQTSGGLLVACAPAEAPSILRRIVDAGYSKARIIGRVEQGDGRVRVE